MVQVIKPIRRTHVGGHHCHVRGPIRFLLRLFHIELVLPVSRLHRPQQDFQLLDRGQSLRGFRLRLLGFGLDLWTK